MYNASKDPSSSALLLCCTCTLLGAHMPACNSVNHSEQLTTATRKGKCENFAPRPQGV
jgi:hypothetical protein